MTKVLITGGLGFIGSNLAHRLLNNGCRVVIIDNMSRIGCKHNLDWLESNINSDLLTVYQFGINERAKLRKAMKGCDVIYHLAGQVSVVDSLDNPFKDFRDNAEGTLSVLECARLNGEDPVIVFSSTNKVYGSLNHLDIGENASRYFLKDYPYGISETQQLDFHSPYGCSKGASDLYVFDYSRTFNMRTVVMRQSCIYGIRQFGQDAQGWISWFVIAGLLDLPISIYGDGKQVRDVLYIDDLVDAYVAVVNNIDRTQGNVYNIGGGKDNTISVWAEFKYELEKLANKPVNVMYGAERVGDQKIYVSDIRKAEQDFGWKPKVDLRQGMEKIYTWVKENLHLLEEIYVDESSKVLT